MVRRRNTKARQPKQPAAIFMGTAPKTSRRLYQTEADGEGLAENQGLQVDLSTPSRHHRRRSPKEVFVNRALWIPMVLLLGCKSCKKDLEAPPMVEPPPAADGQAKPATPEP